MVKKETLAEQVATAVKESILAGEWQAGEALPTEPELSAQFGVSRAVVRDATRMLIAQGLVEAQHGRGVFVTESPMEGFSDALLLALRRMGATAWDVEQFEQMILLPEVCALAAVAATDEEIRALRELAERNLAVMDEILTAWWPADDLPEKEKERFWASGREVVEAIFDASHNRVLQLLARPLLPLRKLRYWEEEALTLAEAKRRERDYFETALAAIGSRDPEQARRMVRERMRLPAEAVEAMRGTRVGEVPVIKVGQ
jgi:GntR family transcriptional repressor for pyruvate dehydrogenase complex